MRKFVFAVFLLVAAVSMGVGSHAASYRPSVTERGTTWGYINGSRVERAKGGVSWDNALGRCARAQAQQMAAAGRIFHDGPCGGHTAETVGTYTYLLRIHEAFLRSPDHRAIIYGNYRHVGTGVVRHKGQWYVSYQFR